MIKESPKSKGSQMLFNSSRLVCLAIFSLAMIACGQIDTASQEQLSNLNIINGEVSKQEDFEAKHVVMVLSPSGSACSGTLILDGTYVLTAAHCLAKKNELVYVGFEKEIDESSKPNEKKLTKILGAGVKHDDFDNFMSYISKQALLGNNGMAMAIENEIPHGDLALVKILASEHIPARYKPVELVDSNTNYRNFQKIMVSGYGITLSADEENEDKKEIFNSTKQELQLMLKSPEPDFNKISEYNQILLKNAAPDFGTLRRLDMNLLDSVKGNKIKNLKNMLTLLSPVEEISTVAGGDSGGSAFLMDTTIFTLKRKTPKLMGVISTSSYLNTSQIVDVRPYLDWITKDAVDYLAEKNESALEAANKRRLKLVVNN